MSSILLIGGNGSLARHLTTRLTAKGVVVHSVIRNPDQIPRLEAIGASPVVMSVEQSKVSDFVDLIRRLEPDVIVWSAGAGGPGASRDRLRGVDTEGHIKIMDAAAQAAEQAGTTRRYISVSSLEVRNEKEKPTPDWYNAEDRGFSQWLWPSFGPYFRARLASDKSLVDGNGYRKLDYTIVRPGWMHSGSGKGKVGAGRCRISGQVSREDVARVLEVCMHNSRTIGLAFDVAAGDTPIEQAVDEAEDTFEGYH